MKYIVTVVFEAQNENDAELAFQNAACEINAGRGCEPLEIAHIKEVLNGNTDRPTLQTVQVLNPEDFSTWESVREARTFGNGMPRKAKRQSRRENGTAYAQLLRKGSDQLLSDVLRHLDANERPARSTWNTQRAGYMNAILAIEAVC